MMILLIGTLFLLEHFCYGKCTTHAMFIKHANASSHGQVLEQKQKENAILLTYENVLITWFWQHKRDHYDADKYFE